MEPNPILTQLQQEMQNDFTDIKAESLLAIALENGLSADDFIIAPDSLFSRAYNRDVSQSAIAEDANKRNFLQLHLSRSGLHDQLPEGVFYQPARPKQAVTNAAKMAADYKIDKQKERETRRFFMPFENAFFGQRLQLELEEIQLLQGLQCGILNEYFMNFWGISPSIPPALITPLIELLPYANKIAGNLVITTQCLEKILQEKVSTRRISVSVSQAESTSMHQLGMQQLGKDMVIGSQFEEDYPLVEFTIGPLNNSKIQDYLEGGDKEEFLKTFYSFFVPIEADVSTRIEVASEKNYMRLDTEEEPVLGYSSMLPE